MSITASSTLTSGPIMVDVARFSGPLDLLLHLIRKEEMDVFDINIHEITKRYLESIKQMKKLNLEVAGEFVAMAATLIQIKARMLLPQYNEAGEVVEDLDPRKDLVRRLVEYQMYQDAGRKLYERPLLGRDMLIRGRREDLNIKDDSVAIEEDNALYALISTYRWVIRRLEKAVHNVARSLKSIRDRIMEIRLVLRVGQSITMGQILDSTRDANDEDVKGTRLITFLSLLELAKLGLVGLFQSENFTDIHVNTQREITEDVIAKVENYESQDFGNSAADVWTADTDDTDAAEDTDATEARDAELPLMAAASTDGHPSVEGTGAEESATDEDILAEEARLIELDRSELEKKEPFST
jgi:segregation and condensation protein A